MQDIVSQKGAEEHLIELSQPQRIALALKQKRQSSYSTMLNAATPEWKSSSSLASATTAISSNSSISVCGHGWLFGSLEEVQTELYMKIHQIQDTVERLVQQTFPLQSP